MTVDCLVWAGSTNSKPLLCTVARYVRALFGSVTSSRTVPQESPNCSSQIPRASVQAQMCLEEVSRRPPRQERPAMMNARVTSQQMCSSFE